MNTVGEYETAFREAIQYPLRLVIGTTLLGVSYWIIPYGEEHLAIDAPNEHGICAVSLVFQDHVLNLLWDTKPLLREWVYHLAVVRVSSPGESFRSDNAVAEVSANQSSLWRDTIGGPLIAVEVYGVNVSPQVVRFVFARRTVVVGIGYGADKPDEVLIGDGDEMVVFSDDQWRDQRNIFSREWTKLWEWPLVTKETA